ncbi:MAG TPA: PDZ domain-containing protein [Gaiellaceae bacterium]
MNLIARLPTRRLLVAAALLLAVCLAFLWLYPSSSYLYVPNKAKPLAEKVEVEGARGGDGEGGIYYVDVTIRKATLLERVVSFLRPDGATIVPREAVVPPGSSFEDRTRAGRDQMARSKEVAAAVALEEAGYDVEAEPEGALIEGVASDAPAAASLEDGDVIIAVEGKDVRTPAQLRREVSKVEPGDDLFLELRRDGDVKSVSVETVPAPDDPERPIIGIQVAQAADIELPLDVEIDLGAVGGPSAGLAFALEIFEQLGRDVDGGYRVAATGEIELDGSIVPVGGLKQKTFGVREADADVFLVPAGDNAAEAKRYRDDLRVIPVRSFQQALRKLATLPPKR